MNKVGTVHTVGKIKYIKTSIIQVKKAITENGEWTGLVVGNKVHKLHFENGFDGGYNLGSRVVFTSIAELVRYISRYEYYLPKELGNRIAFYNIEE